MKPACSTIASAAALAGTGQRARREARRTNSVSAAPRLNESSGLRAGSASILANSFSIARADGAPSVSLRRMVSPSSSRTIVVAAGELVVARERLLDPLRVAAAQRAGGVPRQQGFDVALRGRFFLLDRVHGQPRSIPCAFNSSANFLRA